jgi:hypothetical protein
MVRLPPYFIAENKELSQGNAKCIGIRNNYRGFYVLLLLSSPECVYEQKECAI